MKVYVIVELQSDVAPMVRLAARFTEAWWADGQVMPEERQRRVEAFRFAPAGVFVGTYATMSSMPYDLGDVDEIVAFPYSGGPEHAASISAKNRASVVDRGAPVERGAR